MGNTVIVNLKRERDRAALFSPLREFWDEWGTWTGRVDMLTLTHHEKAPPTEHTEALHCTRESRIPYSFKPQQILLYPSLNFLIVTNQGNFKYFFVLCNLCKCTLCDHSTLLITLSVPCYNLF